MPSQHSQANGDRVLSDLNALRAIGAYKTGVHRPTFSDAHMRSLRWLADRLPDALLTPTIDGIGNVIGTSTKPGPKLLAGSHLERQQVLRWRSIRRRD
jgi:N-carbamoyl-L-amino-acid hydrolase